MGRAGTAIPAKDTRLPTITKSQELWPDLTPAQSQGRTVGIPQTHLGPTLPLIQRCFFRQQPHPCRKSSTLHRGSPTPPHTSLHLISTGIPHRTSLHSTPLHRTPHPNSSGASAASIRNIFPLERGFWLGWGDIPSGSLSL